MIRILDKDLKFVDFLRKYTFSRYTECFRNIGSFQIDVQTDENIYLINKQQQYFVLFDSTHFGVVTSVEKQSDEEYENTITITGKMALDLLNRRIVYKTLKFKGLSKDFVKTVIYDNFVNSSDVQRNMDIDMFFDNISFPVGRCIKVDKSVTGGYVWERIQPVLDADSLGIEITPRIHIAGQARAGRPNIEGWDLTIKGGIDRTKGNKVGNTPVIFSQSYSNIESSSYIMNSGSYCNMAYIAGEGEGPDRKWFKKEINSGDSKGVIGWNRAELWIDARDIQSTDDTGQEITAEEYEELINMRIDERAEEVSFSEAYESTIVKENKQYQYGRDYNLGDFVTVVDDELDITIDVQVTEVTVSEQGDDTTIDIGLTYGRVAKSVIEKAVENQRNSISNESNIRYLENKIKTIEAGGGGGNQEPPDLSGYMLKSGGTFTGDVNTAHYLILDAWYDGKYGTGSAKAWYDGKTNTIEYDGTVTDIDLRSADTKKFAGYTKEQWEEWVLNAIKEGGTGGGLALADVENLAGNNTVEGVALTWNDPDDIIFNGQTLAEFSSTKIMRKQGGYSTGVADGVEIAETTIHDQHAETPLIDTSVVDGETYYYTLFPQTKSGVVTLSDKNKLKQDYQAVSTVLNDNTWDVIATICESGQAQEYWKVGDVKKLVLKGIEGTRYPDDEEVDVVLISFNADHLAVDGEVVPKVLFWIRANMFGSVFLSWWAAGVSGNSTSTWNYNNSAWEKGGYNEKAMQRIPDNLKERMKLCNVIKVNGSRGSSYVSSVIEKLYIPSYREIYTGSITASGTIGTAKEGKNIPYFSDAENRKVGSAWFLRTPTFTSSDYVSSSYRVRVDGTLYTAYSGSAAHMPIFGL